LYEGGRERARSRKIGKEGKKVIPDLVDRRDLLNGTQ
jgi:hypothetical protein